MNMNAVINALNELKGESITSENPKEMMYKYDLMFFGENYNIIYSIELCNALNTYFKVDISIEELQNIIPDICKSLKMECKPMFLAENPTEVYCYMIYLW